ncbi:unnamed protein product [Prunus armeniaca]|uniref:Reverse transcriptase zinc-binding domain-containing protein n=1 Tax=Prunus armeniaca TaxID=36596 RepID=A0A6J5VZH3_PRUAR|nr:unnamed protein product [Prunus armeniaca]
MTCVTTVTYYFLVNGFPVGFISPQRGLRQGDPLSPYLFLLCAVVFSGLIVQAEQHGFLHGIAISRRAPSISHLLFAGDSFLFTRATPEECQHLSYIFQSYEWASGQRINLQKSCVSFSSNVEMSSNRPWPKYLGCKKWTSMTNTWAYQLLLADLVQGWREKLLSFTGKEVLLKVVAQAVPIYQMSYFQIPGSLCDEIQPYSPLARVLKARYHKDYSILEASEGHAPSYIWRSLCDSRVVLARRSRWQIGNGWSVKVWGDRWIPKPNSFQITSATVTGHENVLVCELINPVLHKWHEDLVHAWFGAQEASCILHLPLSFRIPADRLVWHYEKQGDLTVCSAYEVARQFLFEEAGEGSSNRDNYYGVSTKAWSRLWWVCVPPKVKVFVWRVLHNILPTRDRLLSEGVQGDLGGCVLCGAQAESLPHVLLDCSFTALIV